jgi:hypothetical protein
MENAAGIVIALRPSRGGLVVANLRRHLTYANVVSTIAVFLLLGGATAWAASKIGTDQLKAGAVTTGKLAKEAVKSGKIANDAVTGEKVEESTLGPVPKSEEATTLGGIGPSAFTRVATSSTQDTALQGEDGTAQSVSIIAPHDGFLFVVASANVFHEGPTKADSDCRLNLDGTDIPASIRGVYTSEVVPNTDCATNTIVPVKRGRHTVDFTFHGIGAQMGVDFVELNVSFVQLAG